MITKTSSIYAQAEEFEGLGRVFLGRLRELEDTRTSEVTPQEIKRTYSAAVGALDDINDYRETLKIIDPRVFVAVNKDLEGFVDEKRELIKNLRLQSIMGLLGEYSDETKV